MEIRNAKITSTMLGREDHGIMTFLLFVEFGGCGCAIGGYALDAKSIEIISKILDVVGVEKWEDLEGKYIRIKDTGWGSTICEIGNLMNDNWLNFSEFFNS